VKVSGPPSASNTSSGPLLFGYLLACGLVVVWTGWVLVSRFGSQQTLTIWDIVALRFGIAALVILPLAFIWKASRLPLHKAALIIVCFGPVYALFVFGGFTYAPAAHAGVLMNGMLPMITTLIGMLVLNEWPTRGRVVGIVLILIGSVAIGSDGLLTLAPDTWIGDLLYVTAALLLGVYMIAARAWQLTMPQALVSLYLFSSATYIPFYLLSGVPSVLRGHALADWPWDEVLLQGTYQGLIVSFVGFSGFTIATRILGAPTMAAFMAAVPGIVLILAWPLLGEVPSLLATLGVGVATLGILFASNLIGRRI